MTGRIDGKVAVITGSGRGIGRATAELFAQEGATVVVTSRTQSEIDEVIAGINNAGGKAVGRRCDIASQADVEQLFAMVDKDLGGTDILVNNAAIFFPIDFLTADFNEWSKVHQVNLYGAMYCAQFAGRQMVAKGGGRIINVTSVNGFRGAPESSHYNSAKAGLDQITRCLAVELAPHNILVNSLACGFVDTQMSIVDGVHEMTTEWFQRIYVQERKIPLARGGQPHEVAVAALFLAWPENTYITGQVISVDGGLTTVF